MISTATLTPTITPTFTPTQTPTPIPSGPVTITYIYDPLYRLKEANYSNGDYYHYTYDAVGNRLTQQKSIIGLVTTDTYTYDDANRLSSVNGVTYTWDNNGNLLNDGVNTYVYDSANRLKSITGASTANFAYSGLGDRLSQNGVNYTLDLNTGLTQVLNDGTNTYLYGVGRIAQVNAGTEYFLGDALGSVRQLVDSTGNITLAKSYQPYGTEANSAGGGLSSYGFTGEMTDPTGLIYLRARYYGSDTGRFITRDSWIGDYNRPLSLNRWMYVEGNPINYTDPSGNWINPRRPCVIDTSGDGWTGRGWTNEDIRKRVDEAEKYVYHTSDPMDTYVAAGIAIQCAGIDSPSSYSGVGIAQITRKQAETEWGEKIEDIWGNFRGYGLRLKCEDGELEKALNPSDTKDAVILMKREIRLVTDVCGSKCTPTDIYIAAALAQNGPGFSYKEIQGMGKFSDANRLKYGVFRDWFTYFANAASQGNIVNTRTQLNRFILVVNELKRRRWIVPEINSDTIDRLKN